MAFEFNDLKGILILVLFTIPNIPMVASTNINCSGRAFHCVNSTHFMICVDLGGGLTTTIDDFVIPCPATTVCHEKNVFECDFPEVTTSPSPLQVIGVYKQSDTSDSTSVTNRVTAPTPASEIFSVFKENITATTLSIPEDVTPVVNLEVLENIKDPVGVNSDNTTEASFKVTSSFNDSTNYVINDKQTSNKTITISANDNNNHLEPVETSIPVNTSSTDISKSIDTVTSVIGLINLISTDHPSVVNTKPSSDVFTSLDTSYDNIPTTTEQYIPKQVTIHGEKVQNVTEKIIIPTDHNEFRFNERSVTTDEGSTTPVVNTYIKSDINNKTEIINKIESGNKTIEVGNSLGKSNNTSELVPETITEYLAPINIVNISEPVTVDLSPQTTTDNTFVALGLVNLISADPKQNTPTTNDYINTFYGNTATMMTDQYTTKLETTLSDKSVTAEVISTTPIINTIFQNDVNNDFLTELNSTVGIISMKKVPESNINYVIPEPITIESLKTTTEKTFVPIITDANIMYTETTEKTPKSGDLIKNDSLVEKNTIATQPLQIIVTTDSPIQPTDNLYHINLKMNQTMITAKNNRASTVYTIETVETELNASSTDIVNNQVAETTLLPSTTMKNLAIELTTVETLHNGFTAHAKEVKNELRATNAPIIDDEPYVENVDILNDTLLYNTTNTMNTTESVKTVFNASRTDINNGKSTEPSTIKYPTIEISTAETVQNGFTVHAIGAKNELPVTNGQMSVNEANLENVGINTLLRDHTTPAPYNVASNSVTNTTSKDLISQSDNVTNPQIGFTAEIIAHKSSDGSAFIDHGTETKISDSLNRSKNLGIVSHPDNLNADHLNKTVVDKDVVVGMTTNYWDFFENSGTTPFPRDNTGKTSLSEGVKSVNQDDILATNVVNTQDVLIKTTFPQAPSTVYYMSELASTTPITVQTTPISINTMKISEQVSSYTPEVVDINRASTTGYKIDTSTTLPVDVTHKTNIENVTDLPVTTLLPQESASQKIGTVKQLSTTSTTTETVSDLIPFTVTTTGYVLLNSTNLNASSWKDSINRGTVSSKVDPYADVNKTETVKPINGKNSGDATSPSSQIQDENTTIVSVFDIVNSSVNAMRNETLQPTSSNDYTKTTESQDSSAYATASDNVPNYKLVQDGELVTQKNPEGNESFAQTNVTNSIVSTPSTYSLPITEIYTEKVQYVDTEASIPSIVDHLNHINPTTSPVDYVTEKINDNISSTEATITKLLNVKTEPSISSVTYDGFTTVPVYHEVTTIKDSAFITSSTQISPKVVRDSNTKLSTESPSLTSIAIETQTFNYNTESSLPNSELTVAQMTTEPSHIIEVFTKTTPLAAIGKTNQDVLTGIKTTDLPRSVLSTVDSNIPQSMPSLPIVELTAAQLTTEPTLTTKVTVQQLSGTTTADLSHYVMSTSNNNIPQLMASLPIIGVKAAQITTDPTYITNVFAQTTPQIAAIGRTNPNQGVLPGIKTTDFPQSMMLTVNNNTSQSMESLPIAGATAPQITTEPSHTFNVFSQTTPLLGAAGKTYQDVPYGIKTTDLSQDVTTTVIIYNNTQWVSDITTDIITDSLTVPDSMVETIKVVGEKVSGTYLGDTTLSDVITNNPIVNNTDYNVKSVKNIIDHESIVVGATSKNNEQNTPVTSTKSLDINKAEIVNHTESNWMRSDVDIDSVKVKESSIEEEYSKSSVSKSGTNVQNTNLVSDSSIISKIEPQDGIPADKIEYYMLTTVTKDYKEGESGAPINVTQSKKIITKENKNAEIDSTLNDNIEIIDVKRYQVQVQSKNISDSYNVNNTKANITTSQHTLSLEKSTINDDLEQHLTSTNHTITTEVQSHLNESDKQSSKTNDELTLNGTSMHNLNLTSVKLSASSKATSAMNVSASDFNCSNHTRGKYADKKDCRKFYTCIGNLKLLGTCPNNTVFSEINKQCTRNLSHCVRNNQFRCLFEGRFSDFFKDNIYYICVKNRMNGFIRYKLQCQDDYHLNKESVKCEKNEEISTQSVSSVSETNNDESKPLPKLEKIVSIDDFECKNEGKFPYVKDCSKYYVCNQIENVYYICVKNGMSGFIRYKLQCQYDYHLNKDSVQCEKNDKTSIQSVSSVSETNNDESKPQPKSEKNVSTDDFECESEGKFPYAKDCTKYYVCTKIKNVYRRKINKCASEEVFDKKKKKCVGSDSGEC